MIYVLPSLAAFLMILFLIKTEIFNDTPNTRSSHDKIIATSGGIALLAAYLIYSILGDHMHINHIAGISIISIVGILDDKYDLSKLTRFAAQFLSAVFILSTFTFTIPELFFLTIGIVFIINSYNFMDGINMLATSHALFLLSSFLLLSYVDINEDLAYLHGNIILMLLSLIIFSYFNITPAKIFLGNSGSYFLGIYIVAIAISLDSINIITFFILHSIFLVDTLYVLIYKFLNPKKALSHNMLYELKNRITYIFEPHKTHNYQKMAIKYKSHMPVVGMLMSYNILWCFPLAYFSIMHPNFNELYLVMSCLPYTIVCIVNKTGKES